MSNDDSLEFDIYIPVLTAWSTVEINNNLEAVLPCPGDGLVDIDLLSLDVRFTFLYVKGPISNRQSNVIESKIILVYRLYRD